MTTPEDFRRASEELEDRMGGDFWNVAPEVIERAPEFIELLRRIKGSPGIAGTDWDTLLLIVAFIAILREGDTLHAVPAAKQRGGE